MSSFKLTRELKVCLKFDGAPIPVGRLGLNGRRIYFEYDRSFIDKNIEISPFFLPLSSKITTCDPFLFEGLPGVFNDSVPDGWGRLLFDRFIRSQGMTPSEISPLDRLAHAGVHGLGALTYEPYFSHDNSQGTIDLNTLAEQVRNVLAGAAQDVLCELISLNGSSAGARPKALIGLDSSKKTIIHGLTELPAPYTHWIVKFPNINDGFDSGAIEYIYAIMAQQAGIQMPNFHLFSAPDGAGFFAIQRFDRKNNMRVHMHTASGLLHSDFRIPSQDYRDLIGLTATLTKDIREIEKTYRLAVFNVMSHNRDDHAKNFSYLMDTQGHWAVSPGYDLTFSSGPGGEQSTMVMGEGRHPSKEHLIQLGKEVGLRKHQIDEILDQTQQSLSQWQTLAKKFGVSKENRILIFDKINSFS